MIAETMNKRRGLVAMLLVAVTVVMMVCYMAIEPSTPTISTHGRKLDMEATGKENKMAFKAMKINAKYEIKSAMVTTLRGGSVQERHDTFAALKANIYSGIKDMKHVVLMGLKTDGKRRQMESPEDRPAVKSAKEHAQQFNDEPWTWRSIVGEAGRKLPSVHIVKGAFKAMKGQMKSTFIAFKNPIKATSNLGATFQAKHDSIKDMKHQLKGAILINRDIVANDDHNDDAWFHAGTNNLNAEVSKAELEAAAAVEAAAEKAMEKTESKFEAQQKSELKASVKKIVAEENLPLSVGGVVAVAAQKIGEVATAMESSLMGSSAKSSKSESKSAKKSEKKSDKKSSKKSSKKSKK